MAFFSLTKPVAMQQYPFDYHSHFGGILPVEGVLDASTDYQISYRTAKLQRPVEVSLPKGQRLSLVGIMGGTGKYAIEEGTVVLFDLALQMMIEGNPLTIVATKANKAQYERGECAAESIYVACVVLARRWALSSAMLNASATSPELYEEIRGLLRARVQPDPSGPYNPELIAILRYFNNKIYSANKYTPFDDCYKTRSSLMKAVMRDPKYAGRYDQWMLATYAYLYQSGVRCNQAAMGFDEIEIADQIAQSFNALYPKDPSNYRLLVHTSAGYMPGERLSAELTEKILPLLVEPGPSTVIGIDLLGTETKVADYKQLFKFLFENQAALGKCFGTGKGARSAQLICHVHCGEGAASTADNRSMIGYYYANAAEAPNETFYPAYSAYIARGLATAQGRRDDEPRGSRGATPRKKSDVAGLFDELFRSDSLTHGGCTLRRFDINSPASIAIVAYNGKRSEMAMSESLDTVPATQSQSWYSFFSGSQQFAIRLGHAFYYRNYMAQRYPLIAFDTNLGSNAITGASGLFDSVEGYRINRGFRHLDGYIDTDVLHQAGNAVAYLGANALEQAQVAQFIAMVRAQTSVADVLNDQANKTWLYGELTAGMAPICNQSNIAGYYQLYCELVLQLAGQTTIKSYWFDALTRVLTLFNNWRSYLLGADGQGVEHTDIQDEFLRMVILLAYQLLPAGQTRVLDQTMVSLQQLVLNIATDYWKTTVDPNVTLVLSDGLGLEAMDGFKSPASVVTLRRPKPKK
ncbi:hypothetical protein ASE35_13460 [Lysobacter sp. Root916]|uniref:hypothetical protein n=1 Tax=Lysobacter sp. Root916 TaxID=1736606 RepID=UPI0007109AED|nr:hypothetical protein [Lysobacter sp. Root916]KRD31964.1 hypothetical protein ASE35_13460 [Lysobacter sp. Root916]